MRDEEIVNLYWNRQEKAIYETDKKYGKYCNMISFNILQNNEEAKECVNDTYLNTWNSIPPQRPNILKTYIGRITRNLSINQYERRKAKKRDCTLEIALEELNPFSFKSLIPSLTIERFSPNSGTTSAIAPQEAITKSSSFKSLLELSSNNAMASL